MLCESNKSILTEIIKNSQNTVFFGGAGVSTESNIPDFRSENGLYAVEKVCGYPPEFLLSHTFFEQKSDLFFRYYKENLIYANAKPNPAHIALAKLEQAELLSAIVTQNIDGLHQLAGSENVIELHGSNYKQYCIDCDEKYTLDYILDSTNCEGFIPKCKKCGGTVRPNVVLFEEMLDNDVMQSAEEAIARADCLIVGGTSLVVYPAAELLKYFSGSNFIIINKGKTLYDKSANFVIGESIGTVLSEVINGL